MFFIDFAVYTLVGQDAHCVYGLNTTVGVLPHATGRFDPYVLCYSSFIISYV